MVNCFFLRRDRNLHAHSANRRDGGVLFAIKNNLIVSQLNLNNFYINIALINIVDIKVVFNHNSLFAFSVYVPPNTNTAIYIYEKLNGMSLLIIYLIQISLYWLILI